MVEELEGEFFVRTPLPPLHKGGIFPSCFVGFCEVEFDVGADEVVAEGIGEEAGGSGSAEGVEN